MSIHIEVFRTHTVRALLSNPNESSMRRVMKPQPKMDADRMWHWRDCQWMDGGIGFPASGIKDYAPFKPGDTIWVKEKWMPETEQGKPTGGYLYEASDRPEPDGKTPLRWRSAGTMPHKAVASTQP